MKTLITGGRTFGEPDEDNPSKDWPAEVRRLYAALDRIHAFFVVTQVIHGRARGADRHAGRWAGGRGIMERAFPAPWKSQGRAAGPRRNLTMFEASRPDLVVAFPGSSGTANMIKIARDAGTKVIEITQHEMIEAVQ